MVLLPTQASTLSAATLYQNPFRSNLLEKKMSQTTNLDSELEPVRLVIWDLDETYWRGTLADDGDISYIKEHHDIVIALSERGILNSICSKNEFEDVRAVLEQEKIWEYFVFPSINWSSKGSRVLDLIDAFQLRPATVRFIDDNPMNIAEVRDCVPGIQVADPDSISGMLSDPLFRGKEDRELTRLKQYKILEQRRREKDLADTTGSNAEFLKKSQITVSIDYDLENNIDRIIELINRTNTLNFTKRRIDPNLNPTVFLSYLNASNRQAGLVRVADRYGDYGIVGFYLKSGTDRNAWLEHFCFSCRILGMGVEAWLYQKLGSPQLSVTGPVVSDPKAEQKVDWINFGATASNVSKGGNKNRSAVRLLGGCDLDAVGHYLRLHFDDVKMQNSRFREGVMLRQDSSFLAYLNHTGEISPLRRVGFEDEDLRDSILSDKLPKGALVVASFYGDLSYTLFKHRQTGVIAPITFMNDGRYPRDVSLTSDDLLDKLASEAAGSENFDLIRSIVHELRSEWHFCDSPTIPEIVHSTERILNELRTDIRLILLMPSTRGPGGILGRDRVAYVHAITTLAARYSNVSVVCFDDCIYSDSEIQDWWHYTRQVYIRMADRVKEVAEMIEVF